MRAGVADRRRGGLGARRLGAGAGAARCSTTIRQRFKLAVLFITHDLRVAAQVCARRGDGRGRIVEYGSTAEVFTNPQNAYTKALFAAAAPGRNWEFGKFAAA